MIVREKIGDILQAGEPTILFATNREGVNDAGLASKMFTQFPELEERLPMFELIGYGPVLIKSKGKKIIALCCHSLREPWKHNTTKEAIRRLELLGDLGRIAIPMIGTGLVGKILGADWDRIRKMFEDSPLEFVLYKWGGVRNE